MTFHDRHFDDFDFPCSETFRGYYNEMYGVPEVERHTVVTQIVQQRDDEARRIAETALTTSIEARRALQRGKGNFKNVV